MSPILLTSRPRWFKASTTKLVTDGNSIAAGQGGYSGGVSGYLVEHIYPFTMQAQDNVAIGGQNIDQMIADHSDVDAAFDASKTNVLFVQEGTNQCGSTEGAAACQKMIDYLTLMRAKKPWGSILVATAPMVYQGDQATQADSDAWNARIDAYNSALRLRWSEAADGLFETRQPGSPYAQSRYPDYLKETFFTTTVVNGISNTASFVTEDPGGAFPNEKIHYTEAGIALLAPLLSNALLRLRLH